jgi:primosomal protein N'
MNEAILLCSECHIIAGDALCPKDDSVLEYIHTKRAHCSKCGEDWHPRNLGKTCPNCGSWNLNFGLGYSKKRTSNKSPPLSSIVLLCSSPSGPFLLH